MAKTFDELVRRVTTRATRNKAARRTRELIEELVLADIRRMTGKTQQEVARILGIRQPSLSKLESQGDMQLSTLRKMVHAIGGRLHVLASFPQGTVRIKPFDDGVNANYRRARSA